MLTTTIWLTVAATAVGAVQLPDLDLKQPSRSRHLEEQANVQQVILTGRPEVSEKLLEQNEQGGAGIVDNETGWQTSSAWNANKKPVKEPWAPREPLDSDEHYYSRHQLLMGCSMSYCKGTDHCFGNPGSQDTERDQTTPDGSHHQYCCRFLGNATDPATDDTKIVDLVDQCHTLRLQSKDNEGAKEGIRTWCVASDQGLMARDRCEAHGGKVIWNYNNGKIRLGNNPKGKCITLEEAMYLARSDADVINVELDPDALSPEMKAALSDLAGLLGNALGNAERVVAELRKLQTADLTVMSLNQLMALISVVRALGTEHTAFLGFIDNLWARVGSGDRNAPSSHTTKGAASTASKEAQGSHLQTNMFNAPSEP